MTTYVPTKAISLLFLGCLVATVILTPWMMRFARRIGAVDRGGYRKVFEGAMPLLGGLGIALPLIAMELAVSVVGLFVVLNWEWLWIHHRRSFSFWMSLAQARHACFSLAVGGIAIVALGVVDDVKTLRARYKLLGQVVVALFICLSGYALTTVALPFVGTVDFGTGLGGLITMLWVVGLINAFNLIDGIDGLATGIALVGALALLTLSIIQENAFVTFSGAALAGSLFAFLLFNFPPARIFLGDTGSMFLGYALATMSLMGAQKSETAVIIIAPMLALGLPIFETFISIVRRYLRGVPIFAGDNRHTHHRLLLKGYSQPRIVLTLCGTALLLAAAAVISALIPEYSAWVWCPYALYAGTLVWVAWLAGYLRPTTFRMVIERRQRNRVFQALGQYASLRLNSGEGSSHTDLILELCRREMGLRHIEVRVKDGNRLLLSTQGSQVDGTCISKENLRVKSSDGRDVLIGYDFECPPDDTVRQDVSFCLAAIFDQIRIEPTAKPNDESR